MTALEPVPRRKLSHEVLDRLLAGIRGGEWPEGGQMPSERQLMERLQVGRPVVREAMQALARMRLISIAHGERARVLRLSADTVTAQIAEITSHLLSTSPRTLEQLKEARLFFETGMVRIAAQRARPADIKRLNAALAAHQNAADADFLRCDMEFHRCIAAISGNSIYAALSQAIFDWLEQFYVSLVRLPGAENITIEEHRRILDCIAVRDPDAAAAAMTAHLTRASKLYRRLEKAGGRRSR